MRTDREREKEARSVSHKKPSIKEYVALRITTRRSDKVPERDALEEKLQKWEKEVISRMLKDASQSPVLKINAADREFANMLMWNLARANPHQQGPTVLFPESVRATVIKNPILFTQLVFQVCYGDSLDDVYEGIISEAATRTSSPLGLPKKNEVETALTSTLLLISEITYGRNIFRDYLNSYDSDAPGILSGIQKIHLREIQKKLPHNSWTISMLGSQSQENLVHHIAREFVTKKVASEAIALKQDNIVWQPNPLVVVNPEVLAVLKQEKQPQGYINEVRNYWPDRPYAKFDPAVRQLRELAFQYIYEYYRSFNKRDKQHAHEYLSQLQDQVAVFLSYFKKDNPERSRGNLLKSKSLKQDIERITTINGSVSLQQTLLGLLMADGKKRGLEEMSVLEKFCSVFLTELDRGVLYPPSAEVELKFGKYARYAYLRQRVIALIVSYLTLAEPDVYEAKNQFFARFYNTAWVTILWKNEEEFSLELHHTTIENNRAPYNAAVRDFVLEVVPLLGGKGDTLQGLNYIADILVRSEIPLSDLLKDKLRNFYQRLWNKALMNEKVRLIPVVKPTEMIIKKQYYWLNFMLGHLAYVFPEIADKYGFERTSIFKVAIPGRSTKKRMIRISHNSMPNFKDVRLSMNFIKYLRSCIEKDTGESAA